MSSWAVAVSSSDVPQQQMQASEVDEAEEVFDAVFPAGNEAAGVVRPGKEPLHFPAPAIAP